MTELQEEFAHRLGTADRTIALLKVSPCTAHHAVLSLIGVELNLPSCCAQPRLQFCIAQLQTLTWRETSVHWRIDNGPKRMPAAMSAWGAG